jgi:hypothetical protein
MSNVRGVTLTPAQWIRRMNARGTFSLGWNDMLAGLPYRRDYDAWTRQQQDNYERGRLVALTSGAKRPIQRVTMAQRNAHVAAMQRGDIPRYALAVQ